MSLADLVPLAIPSTPVAGGASATITINPQIPFKGEFIVLDPGSSGGAAQAFTVDSVKVGRKEQLLSADPIPGDVFASSTQRPVGLDMEECPTELSITIRVTNIGLGAAFFAGTIYGRCGDCNSKGVRHDAGVRPAEKPPVVLGIPITTVLAGATQNVSLSPQEPFKAEQLVIATIGSQNTGTATDFTVNSIKVGRDEQLISTDGVPGACFAPDVPMAVSFGMKPCDPSLNIVVRVTNTDALNQKDFGGALFGSCGC